MVGAGQLRNVEHELAMKEEDIHRHRYSVLLSVQLHAPQSHATAELLRLALCFGAKSEWLASDFAIKAAHCIHV